jgi:Domain of unknown function (DUF4124)
MYKLVLFFVILLPINAMAGMYKCKDETTHRVTYSDTPCASTKVKEVTKPVEGRVAQPVIDEPKSELPQKQSYTKDLPEMKSPDAASKACFKIVNTTEIYPDPASSKLLSSSKKWVSVKDVGARQMVTIVVTSKNGAGMYAGKQSYECLLMGDGQTVNTNPYELL